MIEDRMIAGQHSNMFETLLSYFTIHVKIFNHQISQEFLIIPSDINHFQSHFSLPFHPQTHSLKDLITA